MTPRWRELQNYLDELKEGTEMKAPRTYFSTQLRTGPTAVRRRLKHLFTAPRRPGIFPLICILILVGLLGCLVACKTDPGQSSPAPSASGAVQPPENSAAMGQIGEGVDVPDAVLSAARAYVQEQYDYWSANTGGHGCGGRRGDHAGRACRV